jgi:hypothetical protein
MIELVGQAYETTRGHRVPKHTHLVVAYNHETKTFWFDGDGSREWIRRAMEIETNTWSDEDEAYVSIDKALEQEAVEALDRMGIAVEQDNWQER